MSYLMLLGGLVLLYGAGESLVRGSSDLALRLGLKPLFVGLTIVAFGTSAPELAVSLSAALDGMPDIAVGNVVGSNIANVLLILSVAAFVRPVVAHAQVVRREIPIMIAVSVVMLVFLADGRLRPTEAGLLVASMIVYILLGIREMRRSDDVEAPGAAPVPGRLLNISTASVLVIIGILGLALGGRLMVGGAVAIARMIGVSEAVIGLTLVAVGTSLPELATSIIASLRGEGDIAIGNVVGSNIFNILIVLGLSGLVAPLATGDVGWFDLWVMLGVALALLPLAWTQSRVSRIEGVVLLIFYALYVTWKFGAHL